MIHVFLNRTCVFLEDSELLCADTEGVQSPVRELWDELVGTNNLRGKGAAVFVFFVCFGTFYKRL